jgi:hypothetical protein
MARVHETAVVIKLSKLVRDGEDHGSLAPADFGASLEALAGELIEDKSIIVEVINDE